MQDNINAIPFLWAAYIVIAVAQVAYVAFLVVKRQRLKNPQR
jgi:hypothetical protein